MVEYKYNGPYDVSDIHAPAELVDFGSIAFSPNPVVAVRAEIEEGTARIVAISFDYKGSTLQVQAFASPKSETIWPEVSKDLENSLVAQGCEVRRESGPVGVELITELEVQGKNRPIRMFGVDGNRWLLRGSISGETMNDIEVKSFLEDMFKGLVVRRGEIPLPPRELLPLNLPQGAIVPKGTV